MVAVPVWILAYSGEIAIDSAYSALDWHAHELIFGYAALVICGFLFTAIPNWTGRLPFSGWPLALLVGVWAAGRLAMMFAGVIGAPAAAVVDVAFLAAVLVAAAREVLAGRNWRNLPVLAFVLCLLAGNVVFHAAILRDAPAGFSFRLAIGAIIGLITLIGGRVTPSFTRNWLVRQKATELPAPFSRFDLVAILVAVVALVAWITLPDASLTAAAAAVAAVLLAVRVWRWRGWATVKEPLVTVLHVGYAFVPVGFALQAIAITWPDVLPASAALHAWTVGAIGLMTLAIMTRASLGHTGRVLTAGRGTVAIYGAMLLAVVARVVAPLAGGAYLSLLVIAATLWTLAFLGFVVLYGPVLVSASPPRPAPPPRPSPPSREAGRPA